MNKPVEEPADVRSLLGMNTPAAVAILLFYCAGIAAPAFIAIHVTHSHVWQCAVTVVAYWCAGIALLVVHGDPLPLRTTVLITAASPVMTALVILTPPWTTYVHAIWPSNVYMVLLTFLCVRGRTGFALIAMATTVPVIAIWTTVTGQGGPITGVMLSLPNFGPLAMSTMFAYTIRPAAAKIYAARAEQDSALQRIEKEAEKRKVLDQRLRDLAEAARPLVEQVGDGRGLTPDHAKACEALESQLSAILRGSGLVHAVVNPSADAARDRGVAVKLFDDGDLDELDDEVRERLLRGIAAELDEVQNGEIIIRTVPPGRAELATVRAQSDSTVRRVGFGPSGERTRSSVRSVA
ncbi:hypothetical protein ACFZC5_02150 [Nocardia gamkensis]|jgi:hypothetical protein|uniref:hypothetical protein n=1 Tax=Nocardia gamkensis TaxID=352869 RepID=UPI0036E91D58